MTSVLAPIVGRQPLQAETAAREAEASGVLPEEPKEE